MVRMRSARRGLARRPAHPRSRWRRLWDWLLTFAILGLLILLAARFDRTETRNLAGRATVNDGDSITLGTERIGCVASMRRSSTRPVAGRRRSIPAAAAPVMRSRADRRPAGLVRWLGARQIRPAAGDLHGRRQDLNRSQVEAGWAVAYGDYEAERTPRAEKAPGSGPARSTVRATGATCMAAWPRASTQRPASILNWLRQMLRFS